MYKLCWSVEKYSMIYLSKLLINNFRPIEKPAEFTSRNSLINILRSMLYVLCF